MANNKKLVVLFLSMSIYPGITSADLYEGESDYDFMRIGYATIVGTNIVSAKAITLESGYGKIGDELRFGIRLEEILYQGYGVYKPSYLTLSFQHPKSIMGMRGYIEFGFNTTDWMTWFKLDQLDTYIMPGISMNIGNLDIRFYYRFMHYQNSPVGSGSKEDAGINIGWRFNN